MPQVRETERAVRRVEHHGDVVLAATRFREIDERGRRAIEVRASHGRCDLPVGDVSREPVGAEQEPVAGPECLEEHVGLHAARIPDESRDRALQLAGVIGGDEADIAPA